MIIKSGKKNELKNESLEGSEKESSQTYCSSYPDSQNDSSDPPPKKKGWRFAAKLKSDGNRYQPTAIMRYRHPKEPPLKP